MAVGYDRPPRHRRKPASHSHRQPRRARHARPSAPAILSLLVGRSDQEQEEVWIKPALRWTGAKRRSTPSTKRNSPSSTVACRSSNCCNFPSCTGRFQNFPPRKNTKPIRRPRSKSGGNQAAPGALARISADAGRAASAAGRAAARRFPRSSRRRKQAAAPWQPYSVAWMIKYLDEIRHEPVDPSDHRLGSHFRCVRRRRCSGVQSRGPQLCGAVGRSAAAGNEQGQSGVRSVVQQLEPVFRLPVVVLHRVLSGGAWRGSAGAAR